MLSASFTSPGKMNTELRWSFRHKSLLSEKTVHISKYYFSFLAFTEIFTMYLLFLYVRVPQKMFIINYVLFLGKSLSFVFGK